MDDALLVRGFERLRDLLGNGQRFVDRDGTVRDTLGEIVTLDEFHHEGVYATGLLEPVDRRDVGMIQRRERLRLALETRQAFGISRERVRQDLDRDLAAERRVRRTADLPHTALAYGRADFVHAETSAGSEGQR